MKHIRPFYFDPAKENPLQFAVRDDGDIYIVERIADIRGDPKGKKSQIELQVHWVGCEHPTREPWANVRSTQALHDLLQQADDPAVQRLLPKKKKEL